MYVVASALYLLRECCCGYGRCTAYLIMCQNLQECVSDVEWQSDRHGWRCDWHDCDVNNNVSSGVNKGVNTAMNTKMNRGMNNGVNAKLNSPANTGRNTNLNKGVNTGVNTSGIWL